MVRVSGASQDNGGSPVGAIRESRLPARGKHRQHGRLTCRRLHLPGLLYLKQGSAPVAGHGQFVAVNIPNDPFAINDVGYSMVARPEPAAHVVESAHPAFGIAGQGVGNAQMLGQPPQPVRLVGADAQDEGIVFREGFLGFSKSPVFSQSTGGVSQREKEDDHISAPVLRKGKFLAGSQGNGEVGSVGAYFQHKS